MGFMSWIRTAATNVSSACKAAVAATSAAAGSATRAIGRAVDRVASAASRAYDAVKRAAAAATRRVVKFFQRLSESKVARRILYFVVAAMAGAAVAAVVFLCVCFLPAGGLMMVGPALGGLMILRLAFAAYPALYFSVLRFAGPAAAASLFGYVAIAMPIVLAFACVINAIKSEVTVDEDGLAVTAIHASVGDRTTSGGLDLVGRTEATKDPLMEDEETRANLELDRSTATFLADDSNGDPAPLLGVLQWSSIYFDFLRSPLQKQSRLRPNHKPKPIAMASLIANISAVVTGALQAAIASTVEMLPTDATRDAVRETAKASVAWLVAARDGAVEKFPLAAEAARTAAGSAVEASEPWVEMASKRLLGLYGRLVTASAGNLPDCADATATGGRADQHVVLLALIPVVFICGAVWALTCRTMKGPGLGGARMPRAMFEASPKTYYAAVRTGRRAQRDASGAGWTLLVAAAVAYGAYLAAKALY
ncbi:hypothetical protein ACQ4PT_060963 [Festuca glaucescens]